MCTLIVTRNIFPNAPIVVAANRDERYDRPSELPEMRNWERRIFAPKDLRRGGSWIGVNGSGVFAAITNRSCVVSVQGRISRGDLVMGVLQYSSAMEAFDAMQDLRGADYNGFHLVLADKRNLFILRGDGKTIDRTEEAEKLLIITNHGIGRGEIITDDMPPRVKNILRIWQGNNIAGRRPTVRTLTPLLNIHGSWIDGTCINDHKQKYGTKSSSIIMLQRTALGDQWQYYHRERKAADRHICVEKFASCMSFPVDNS